MFEVKVTGMSCPSCASSIEHALRSIDPKVEVSVDIPAQTVRVKSQKEEKAITSLIEEAGFSVVGVKIL